MPAYVRLMIFIACFLLCHTEVCAAAAQVKQGHVLGAMRSRRVPGPQPQKGAEGIEQMLELQERLSGEMGEIERQMVLNDMQTDELLRQRFSSEERQAAQANQILELADKTEALKQRRAAIKEELNNVSMQIGQALGEVPAPVVARIDEDINRIVSEHSKPVPWDGKIFVREPGPGHETEKVSYKDLAGKTRLFERGKFQVTQLGALGQKRSPEDHNNYCGYYAVYNLLCLSLWLDVQEQLLNRKTFAELFMWMLQDIKIVRRIRQGAPYDNLTEDEIESLLKEQGIRGSQYLPVQLHGMECGFTDLTIGIEQSGGIPEAYILLEDFKARKIDSLAILFNVGLHWVAMKAMREGVGIHLYIVDSLNEVDWINDNDSIRFRLLPLYRFLTED